MQRMSGIVKWYNEEKGFGLVQPDLGGKDIIIHISELKISELEGVKEGNRISYRVENVGEMFYTVDIKLEA